MRLIDSVLLSLSVVFFIIGVHQVMTLGIAYAYWILMLSIILLFWYRIRKKNQKQKASDYGHNKKRKKHSK